MAHHPKPDKALVRDLLDANLITTLSNIHIALHTHDPDASFVLAAPNSLTYWWLTTGRHLPLYQRRGPRIEEISYSSYARCSTAVQEPTEGYLA